MEEGSWMASWVTSCNRMYPVEPGLTSWSWNRLLEREARGLHYGRYCNSYGLSERKIRLICEECGWYGWDNDDKGFDTHIEDIYDIYGIVWSIKATMCLSSILSNIFHSTCFPIPLNWNPIHNRISTSTLRFQSLLFFSLISTNKKSSLLHSTTADS